MVPYHINDPEFVNEVVSSFLEICSDSSGTIDQQTSVKPNLDLKKGSASAMSASGHGTISYSLSNFPNAKPGYNMLYLSV